MGVANERSIAWGIAKKLSQNVAELAFTYLGDALKKRVTPLAESIGSKFLINCKTFNCLFVKFWLKFMVLLHMLHLIFIMFLLCSRS